MPIDPRYIPVLLTVLSEDDDDGSAGAGGRGAGSGCLVVFVSALILAMLVAMLWR